MLPKMIAGSALLCVLGACGAETLTTIQQPGQPGQPRQPTPVASYQTDGFDATFNNTLTVVTVFEQDGTGRPQNYRQTGGTDLQVTYRRGQDLQVVSEGLAFDGTIDRESGTLRRNPQNTYGQIYENQGRILVQQDSYIGSFRVDENDGRYRHMAAFAGGRLQAPDRATGGAQYTGGLYGAYEIFENTGGFQGGGLQGDVVITTNLNDGTVITNFNDPSNGFSMGGLATISADGRQYQGSIAGSIPLTARSAAMTGTVSGFFAGTGGVETAGTISGEMNDSAGRQGAFSGGFVADQ